MTKIKLVPHYLDTVYNTNSAAFMSVFDDLSLWAAPFGLKLLDIVQYKKNIHVLDVGFGAGFPLLELAMRLGNTCRVHGIDPWKAGIDRVKQKIAYTGCENITLTEGIAEQTPYENDYFDLIVSNNGINNVGSIPAALAECRRVSKKGAQFVCTFNTEKTFLAFYDIYRRALRELSLQQYEENITAHIYSKRKPLDEMEAHLALAGFAIKQIYHDEFSYRFADGTAMLHHFAMQYGFMDSWKHIVPHEHHRMVFEAIERLMNEDAQRQGGFVMNVPFVAIDARAI